MLGGLPAAARSGMALAAACKKVRREEGIDYLPSMLAPPRSRPDTIPCMDRRDFFNTLGLGTYSLVVLAGEGDAQQPAALRAPEFDRVAPPNAPMASAERHMREVRLDADIVVAGGGLAGVCAAD